MSGFQIPGLGQAKPNETLPPFEPAATIGNDANTVDKDTNTATGTKVDAQEPAPKDEKPAEQAPPVYSTAQPSAPGLNDEGSGMDVDVPSKAEPPNQADQTVPSDLIAAASSLVGIDEELLSAYKDDSVVAAPKDPAQQTNDDSMDVDEPNSPPSLTHALEAILGGLPAGEGEAGAVEQPANEVPVEGAAGPEWEVDSSPYQSSSESSSDVSSSDEDSDAEDYEPLGIEETARLLMEAEGGSDDEGDKGGKASGGGQVRTKNELPEELIPRPDVTITPEMKVEELGAIEHIVDDMVVIKAFTPGEYQVLDTGSVLCNTERQVVGVVSETIGKVLQPMYIVRFNSADEIKELSLEKGSKILYPVDHASYVFTEPLRNLKGSDASNLHDEEVADGEMEFSDDEKEAEYKRSLKQKKKDKRQTTGGGRGGSDRHPLRQEMRPDGGLNYDDGDNADDDDGPYKPLTRPAGFGSGPVSQETYELPPRANQRGGRRGDSRGRGGRGRGGRGGHQNHPRDGYALPPQGSQPPQQQQQQQPPMQWSNMPTAPSPSMPHFGFQFPGMPPLPPPLGAAGQHGSFVPPPPPGWPSSTPAGQVNPAFLAALMSQMQAQGAPGQSQSQGQGPWNGQQQPPGGQ